MSTEEIESPAIPQMSFLRPPSIKVSPQVDDKFEGKRMTHFIKDASKIRECDIALIGVPFDGGTVTGRPGARFGPQGVRQAFLLHSTFNPVMEVELNGLVDICDLGDIDVLNTNIAESEKRIEKVLTWIHETGALPVMIGGDHTITFSSVKALTNTVKGKVGVIVFDCHYDMRISHHGEISCGTPFRRVLDSLEGRVDGPNLVQIGIHSFIDFKFYRDYMKSKGTRLYTALEVHERGIQNVVKEALEYASDGTDAIYFSFDIDSVDHSMAPGTSSPMGGGVLSWEAIRAVEMIARNNKVKAFDIVEVSPPLDHADITTQLAAGLVNQFITGFALRRQSLDF
jgi:formimidoylglutamase